MSFEQWGILAEIVASLATVGALLGLTLELRKSRQIENRQIIFESQEKWENLSEERKMLGSIQWEDFEDFRQKYEYGDRDSFHAYDSVMNFFEMISEMAHLGVIDKKLIIQSWGLVAVNSWELAKEIQLAYRGKQFPFASIHLEWFVNEVLKDHPEYAAIAQKMSVERIARLRDESA